VAPVIEELFDELFDARGKAEWLGTMIGVKLVI
jgi:hypothetical protein